MNSKKIFITLIVMNVFQIVLTLFVVALMFEREDHIWTILAYSAVFFTVFNALITVLAYNFINKAKNTGLVESIKNLEELNTTLREQRHDYLNHIQVIYGLMELGEYEEAKKYLNPVFKALKKVSLAMKTAQPAVNALLQAKLQMAEKEEIDVYLDITTDLKALPIEPWELCKVLSNIIDNGITALQPYKGKKEIHIEMAEDSDDYQFRITNNGPKIEKEKLAKIFEAGYTTKKEEGHGMGLHIVSGIVNAAHGKIAVKSDDEETCFSFSLRKVKFQGAKETV